MTKKGRRKKQQEKSAAKNASATQKSTNSSDEFQVDDHEKLGLGVPEREALSEHAASSSDKPTEASDRSTSRKDREQGPSSRSPSRKSRERRQPSKRVRENWKSSQSEDDFQDYTKQESRQSRSSSRKSNETELEKSVANKKYLERGEDKLKSMKYENTGKVQGLYFPSRAQVREPNTYRRRMQSERANADERESQNSIGIGCKEYHKVSYGHHMEIAKQKTRTDKKNTSNKWKVHVAEDISPTRERDDEEFNEFDKNWNLIPFKKVIEKNCDLFDMPEDYSLGHCVAVDLEMGAGIALQFRQRFKNVDELRSQEPMPGGLAVLQCEQRFIYYLITKWISTRKPTHPKYMLQSLQKMKRHIVENNIKKLALPRIGCGLDGMYWHYVKAMLEYVFQDVDIELCVCSIKKPNPSNPRSFRQESNNLIDTTQNTSSSNYTERARVDDGNFRNKNTNLIKDSSSSFRLESNNCRQTTITSSNSSESVRGNDDKFHDYWNGEKTASETPAKTEYDVDLAISNPVAKDEDGTENVNPNAPTEETSKAPKYSPKSKRNQSKETRWTRRGSGQSDDSHLESARDENDSKNKRGDGSQKSQASTKNKTKLYLDNSKKVNTLELRTFGTFESFISIMKKPDYKYVKVKEIQADLFAMPKEYSLGHCVAEDMNMGSGIAVQFRQQFKSVGQLLDQRQKQGGLAVLDVEGRKIYYLVTKRTSSGKPTYETFWRSLHKMMMHISENEVKKLALPRLGCGLDGLEWGEVKNMIEYVFMEVDIEITVCNFQQDADSAVASRPEPQKKKCKLVNDPRAITELEAWSIIIYLGSEDGYVTDEIKDLDVKFNIEADYKREVRSVGKTIRTDRKNYILYCFIVRKKKNDLFGYAHFQACLNFVRKSNAKDLYEYVGIQAFEDGNDWLIMSKLVNLMRNTLIYVDVYICWPPKLQHAMPKSV